MEALSVTMTVGTLRAVTVVLIVAEHPEALVAVTVYVPPLDTAMVLPATPVLQWYVEPPVAVKMTRPPWQKLVSPLMYGVGIGLTIMVVDAVFVQLLSSVTNTVYVVEVLGDT